MELVPIIPEDAAPTELLPEDLAGSVSIDPDFETEFVPPDNLEPNSGINDQKSTAYAAAAAPEKPAEAPEPRIDTAADQSTAASVSVVTETVINVTALAGTFIAEPAPVVVMETQWTPNPSRRCCRADPGGQPDQLRFKNATTAA
jgi:hypothetical protein